MAIKKDDWLIHLFKHFIENHSPEQVSKHLRIMFLDYLAYNSDIGLPNDFKICLKELNALFHLLDTAAEYKKRK